MTKEEAHIKKEFFPLEGFLTHLRAEGFSLGPEQYHEVNVLLNTLAIDYDFEELAQLLCPLFARNREEQLNFYEVFQQYFSNTQSETKRSPKTSSVELKQEQKKNSPTKKKWYDNDFLRVFGFAFALVAYLFFTFWFFDMASNWMPDSLSEKYQDNPPNFVIIAHICLAILLFLLYQIRRFFRKKGKDNQRKPTKNNDFSKSPPFTFRPKINLPSLNLLPKNEALHLNRALVSQADDYINTGIPDIHKTLQKTVENAGLVEIQYQRYHSKPRYLLLIDTAQSNKHQAEWFDYLAYILQDSDTTVEKYFFDQDPRFVRANKGDQEIPLTNIYNAQRLLILTEGANFMNTISGELYAWVTDLFHIWDEKAVLTDRAIEDWDARERCLDAEFEIAPATIDGLLSVIDDFDNRQENNLEDWQKNDAFDYLGTEEVSILQSTLPQEVFLWLCTCAVFPRLYWDLTLYLGMNAEVSPNQLLNPKYLSLLNRLKWIREGKIPASKRSELISYLPAERMLSTRRALVKILQDKRSIPPFDSYAFEEHQVFLLRNKYEVEESEIEKKRIYQDLEILVEETGEDSAEILEFLEREKAISSNQREIRFPLGKDLVGLFMSLVGGNPIKKHEDELTWLSYRNTKKAIRIKNGVKEKVADSQEIILILHGLLTSTEQMASAFRKQIESERYDAILAFDYESVETSLSKSAVILQEKLAEVGISRESKKRITIITENSGAIVARWLIEQLDGRHFTKQLILFGPANGGFKFADFYRRFGRIISIFPFATRIAFNLIPTMEQLPTNSDIVKDLNRSQDPHIPYKIIHGSIEQATFNGKKISRWTRLIANLIIREDSDGAVGISSAKSVGNGERPVADEEAINSKVGAEGIFGDRRPIPHFYQVPCLVGEYFNSEESLFRLNALLAEKIEEREELQKPIDEVIRQKLQDFSPEEVPNILEDEQGNINIQQSIEVEELEVDNVIEEPISLLDHIYHNNRIGSLETKEDVLRDVVEYLKNTKEKEDLRELDLRDIDVSDLTLNTPTFVDCSFSSSKWSKMLVIRAEMKQVNMGGMDLNNSDFIQLKSQDSNYKMAFLFKNLMNKAVEVKPKFIETNITDCDYYYSEFELGEFTQTRIKGCNFNFTRFESCKFTDCDIINSEFNEANFSLTEFDNCRFSDLQLKDAQFRNVVFRNMDMRKFDFEVVRFDRVQMIDCEYSRGDVARFNRKELEVISRKR